MAGIFTVFISLGYLTSILKSIVMIFGIGGNFQQPEFIIILCLLMTFFTSNVLGRTHITLPEQFSTKLNNVKFNNMLFNSFASGAIAAIFSTPCTAPFLGTAISFAMTSETEQIMQIFGAIALGFSSPYIMLIITPRLGEILPKPGPWMESFKRILALCMILTIFWLLNVLWNQIGYRATLGTALLLILIKFIFEQRQINYASRSVALILLVCGLLYLPGIATEQDYEKSVAQDLLWKDFSTEELARAKDDGKIIVVDITASWCVTCKYNDLFLWSRNRTMLMLKNDKIIAFRGDVTTPVQEIEEYLKSYGVYGIPFNIVYGPNAKEGIVLPVIPSYDELQKALEEAGL
jgi:suppressor for copper-sensitivity B